MLLALVRYSVHSRNAGSAGITVESDGQCDATPCTASFARDHHPSLTGSGGLAGVERTPRPCTAWLGGDVPGINSDLNVQAANSGQRVKMFDSLSSSGCIEPTEEIAASLPRNCTSNRAFTTWSASASQWRMQGSRAQGKPRQPTVWYAVWTGHPSCTQ